MSKRGIIAAGLFVLSASTAGLHWGILFAVAGIILLISIIRNP
jgi:hypothetical protein